MTLSQLSSDTAPALDTGDVVVALLKSSRLSSGVVVGEVIVVEVGVVFGVVVIQGVQKFVDILTPLFSLAWVLRSGSYSTC